MGSSVERFLQSTGGAGKLTEPGTLTGQFISGTDEQTRLQTASAFEGDGDKAGRVLGLEAKTGLPHDLIERNLPDIEKEVNSGKFDVEQFRRTSPIMAQWLSEHPAHLALASEDLTKLSYLERHWRNFKDQFKAGMATTRLSDIGTKAMLGTATPEDRKKQKELEDRSAVYSIEPDALDLTGLEKVPGAMAQQLPIFARTLAMGGAGAAVIGGATRSAKGAEEGWRIGAGVEAGRMEAALAYLDYEKIRDDRGEPLSRKAALGAAVTVGIVNGSLEMMGFEEMTKTIPGMRILTRDGLKQALTRASTGQALRRYLENIGEATVTEGFTEFLQELVTSTAGEMTTMLQDGSASTMTGSAILDRIFSAQHLAAAFESGKMGAMAGGGMTSATGTVQVATDIAKARQAQAASKVMSELGTTVQASKMMERLPSKMQEAVERLAADGQVENLYSPINVWNEYWQSKGLDPEQVAASVLGPRGAEAHAEAERTGGDLEIPTGKYASTLAATDHHSFFVNELRAGPSELSAREAQEMVKAMDEESAAVEQEAKDERTTQVSEIVSKIKGQLEGSGFDPKTAQTYSSLFQHIFNTAPNMSPSQVFDMMGLNISRIGDGKPTGLAEVVLNQDFTPEQRQLSEAELISIIGQPVAGNAASDLDLLNMLPSYYLNSNHPVDMRAKAIRHQMQNVMGIHDVIDDMLSDEDLVKKIVGEFWHEARLGGPEEGQEWRGESEGVFELREHYPHIEEPDGFLFQARKLSTQDDMDPSIKVPGHAMKEVGTALSDMNMRGELTEKELSFMSNIQHHNEENFTWGQLGDFLYSVSDDKRRNIFSESPQLRKWYNANTKLDAKIAELLTGFHSKAERTIEQKMGGRATVSEVRALLKEVKEEEKHWSGINEFLDAQPDDAKVTKDAVLAALHIGRIQIKEINRDTRDGTVDNEALIETASDIESEIHRTTVREILAHASTEQVADGVYKIVFDDLPFNTEQPATQLAWRLLERFLRKYYEEGDFTPLLDSSRQEALQEFKSQLLEHWIGVPAEDHRAEGGTELNVFGAELADAVQQYQDAVADWAMESATDDHGLHDAEGGGYSQYTLPGGENYREILLTIPSIKPTYESGHFEGNENIVVHFRLKDRTDADGSKMLFVEEIQSDWHQDGREWGYTEPSKNPPQVRKSGGGKFWEVFNERTGQWNSSDMETSDTSYEEALKLASQNPTRAVPDAPFKATWHELALKRILRMAAEGGYESIGWTTGDQQAERYNLSKVVDEIAWEKEMSAALGTYKILESGEHVRTEAVPTGRVILKGNRMTGAFKSADVFDAGVKNTVFQRTVESQDLHDLVGKELSAKINTQITAGETSGSFSGEELKVGGHGMREFYDRVVPSFLRKFIKKYKAEVGNTSIREKQTYSKEQTGDKWAVLDLNGHMLRSGLTEEQATSELNMLTQEEEEHYATDARVHHLLLTPELKRAALDDEFTLYQGWQHRAVRARFAGDAAEIRGIFSSEQVPFNVAMRNLPLIEFLNDYGLEPDQLHKVELIINANPRPKEGKYRATILLDLNSGEKLPMGHLANDDPKVLERLMDDLQFKPTEFRQEKDTPRGRIRIGATGINIELLKTADLSTFIHETGHFFLETLQELAAHSEEVASDLGTIRSWLGMKEDEKFDREHHELFARGFERYLMEGKAPVPRLQMAFARFKAWMVGVYRSLADLNVNLTDEVRGVFDRLLAAQDEIEKAQKEQNQQPLFADPEAVGLSKADADSYNEAVRQARLAAEEELTAKIVQEFEREKKRVWNAEKIKVRAEIGDEADQDKTLRTFSLLRNGKLPSGKELEGFVPFKLDRADVLDQYKTQVPDQLLATTGGKTRTMSPAHAADLFGFSSPEELLDALAQSEDPKEWVEKTTNSRMRSRRYEGTPLKSAEIPVEARKAVHNEKRAQLMQRELQVLAKQSISTVKGMVRKMTRRLPRLDEVRDEAQRIVQSKVIRSIKPDVYRRAESEAAKTATELFLKGDFEGAFDHKQRELLNHELFRAASTARDEITSGVKLMNKFNDKKARQRLGRAGANYLEQIDSLLSRFNFSEISGRQLDRKQSLQQFLDEQIKAGLQPDIPDNVRNEAFRKNYKELTLDEFRGVIESAKLIRHLATLKNKLLASTRARNVQQAVDDIVARVRENFDIDSKEPIDLSPNLATRIKRGVKGMVAAHTKMEFMFEWLDGNKDNGPVWGHLFEPLAKAESAEYSMMQDAVKGLRSIFEAYPKLERATWFWRKTKVAEINMSLTKANMLAVALNWGNDGNRQALMDGYGWSEQQVGAILGHLDARDWEAVQRVWDLIDQFWPQIETMEKDLNGLAPEKVEAAPITNRHGTFRGGYYPIAFDANLSWKQALLDKQSSTDEMFGGRWAQIMTRHGHTNERVGSGGKPVKLDLSVLTQHVTNVVHDLTHRRAVIDVNRLTQRDEVRIAIENALGKDMYKQIYPWLVNVARGQQTEFTNPIESLLARGRMGATVVNMGWKMSTAIVQFLSYTNTVKEIGIKHSILGMSDFWAQPWKMRESWDFIKTRSPFMEARITSYDRDVRDALSNMNVAGAKPGPLSFVGAYTGPVRDSFFMFIGLMDMAVSVPSWMGAYRKAMDGAVDGIQKGTEDAAIQYADKIVRETQGVGAAKDMAAVQRGSEAYKIFAMFYSYFSVLFNQFAKTNNQLRLDKNLPKYVASLAMLWFAPAVMQELLVGRGPDKDDDMEEWLKWLAKTEAKYPFQTVILVRDIVNGMDKYGYEPSAALDAFGSISETLKNAGKVFTDEEITRANLRSAAEAAGYATKLPSRQMWLTGEYVYDWLTGAEQPDNPFEAAWRGLVTGGKKE